MYQIGISDDCIVLEHLILLINYVFIYMRVVGGLCTCLYTVLCIPMFTSRDQRRLNVLPFPILTFHLFIFEEMSPAANETDDFGQTGGQEALKLTPFCPRALCFQAYLAMSIFFMQVQEI